MATALVYADPKQAVRMHCKYPKLLKGDESLPLTDSPRGINIIPESDVFRLIMRSNLPSAERFQDWVVEDVLPTLRKHEQYTLGQETMDAT
ncbi:MAG: BRO family protein [Desulfobacterales bacterium]